MRNVFAPKEDVVSFMINNALKHFGTVPGTFFGSNNIWSVAIDINEWRIWCFCKSIRIFDKCEY